MKGFWTLVFLLSVAGPCFAAVAFDSKAQTSGVLAPDGVISRSITSTMGSDGKNILIIALTAGPVDATDPGGGIASVDVNGSAVSLVSGTGMTSMYYFLVSSTGSYTVNVHACASSGECNGSVGVLLDVISLKNVDPTTPLGTPVTGSGTGLAISKDIVGTSSNNIVVDAFQSTNVTYTVGAGQTYDGLAPISVSGGGFTWSGGISRETSTNGTVTMSHAISSSKGWGTVVVEVKAAALPAFLNGPGSITGISSITY